MFKFKRNMKKGCFITLEGPEGSGKSTQAKLLYEYLIKDGYKAIHTREPGGTGVSEAIRKLLLSPEFKIHPIAELLLYEASRCQHIYDVILPNLRKGHIIVCERYSDATVAYQGYGRGIDLKIIHTLNKIATSNLKPDITIYLDIPSHIGLDRAKKKIDYLSGDRMENESLKFHNKVREGYLKLARTNPRRIKVIEVQPDLNITHAKILKTVLPLIKKIS